MHGRRRGNSDPSDRPARSATDRALTWLARREYSRQELQTRLRQAGCDEAEIVAALADLAQAGYQSDRRFAEMLVRSRVSQGYGPSRLRAELRTHALDDALIETVIEQADADWLASAQAQVRRRMAPGSELEYAERARHTQYLLRRGFDVSTARAAVEEVMRSE